MLSTVRGFVTRKGVPGDRKKQLEDAMIKAMEHKYFQSFLTDIGQYQLKNFGNIYVPLL